MFGKKCLLKRSNLDPTEANTRHIVNWINFSTLEMNHWKIINFFDKLCQRQKPVMLTPRYLVVLCSLYAARAGAELEILVWGGRG